MSEFSQKLSDRLREISMNITQLEEDALEDSGLGLTLSEMHLLGFIYNYENAYGVGAGVRISDIADALSISRPSATVGAKKLHTKGYITKEPDPIDGRVTAACLTTEGRRVYNRHRKSQSEVLEKLEKEFSLEEQNILLRAVDRMAEYYKGYKAK
jgi:DNA-binding MarR family transcriptional regulator